MSSSRSAICAARPWTRGSSDSGPAVATALWRDRRRRVSTPTTMSAPTARIRNRTNPPETPDPSSLDDPEPGAGRAGGPARGGHPRQPRLRQPPRHRDRPRHGVAAECCALGLEGLLHRPRGQARPDRQVPRRQHQDVPAVPEPLSQAHRVALRVGGRRFSTTYLTGVPAAFSSRADACSCCRSAADSCAPSSTATAVAATSSTATRAVATAAGRSHAVATSRTTRRWRGRITARASHAGDTGATAPEPPFGTGSEGVASRGVIANGRVACPSSAG